MDPFDAIDDQFASYAKLLMEDPSARLGALRNCSFFQPVPDDWLRRICEMAQVRTFRSDVSITTQDEEMKAFYVILYGAADAYRNGKVVGTIETGDCFGEAIFFSDGTITTSATVIADDKIIAAEFSKDAIHTLQSDADAMVSMNKALLLALFKKLKGANQKIAHLMLM
ncbi:cyclic nucleotide-binding domain-containing protein [Ramlibacter albus]|uniref:Cyclic nucleotide-binding domain-containing protein n=1 Tax=Ramlibacter albus TaxID=2079448 RepID=A0A923MEY4_9BURK|nr:cyclic nucleotide-binding domain-containing protein [Ramlibacter albus]MBC5768204.1 cyclic nucleotide-binding domain-containing protein [Ramlibacter albus]